MPSRFQLVFFGSISLLVSVIPSPFSLLDYDVVFLNAEYMEILKYIFTITDALRLIARAAAVAWHKLTG